MKGFDLHEFFKRCERSEKIFWQSMNAATDAFNGKNVQVVCPDEDAAKKFMTQVKKRLEERDRLLADWVGGMSNTDVWAD